MYKNTINTPFHMRSQPLFHAEKVEKSVSLAFKIESDIMICSLKPLPAQQFVKTTILVFRIQCNIIKMRPQPQFHLAI